MIVCKVWDSEYPWDVRVAKIAQTLSDASHIVHLVARNRTGGPAVEHLSECIVHRLSTIPSIGRRLNDLSMFPAFFNPRWFRLIWRTASQQHAGLILVRDLPLAPTAIWVGRLLRLPVVLDMAENYPAMIRAVWETGRRRPTDILVRNPSIVRLVEQYAVRHVDHVLVVTEESRDRLLSEGIPEHRITIVSNTPHRSRIDQYQNANQDRGAALRVFYLGLLEVARGIGVLLEAVARSVKRGPITLDIVGAGRDESLFQDQAARLGLGPDVVRFHGFVRNQEALAAMGAADVGIIPHFADEAWNTTIPNKLFDYMAAGLPVVTSDAAPPARIVRSTGAGVVFRDRDADDLARALERLRDPERRKACGMAGRAAIASVYHWEKDAAALLAVIDQFRDHK